MVNITWVKRMKGKSRRPKERCILKRSSMANNTISAKRKLTVLESTAEIGKISRGKYTFVTRPAWLTRLFVAPITPVKWRFQARIPTRIKMGKLGILLPGINTVKTRVKTSIISRGLARHHRKPSAEFL